jgi:hypothetical protein
MGQTYKYVKSGLLVRIARGVFKLAPRGVEIADEVKTRARRGREPYQALLSDPERRRARRVLDLYPGLHPS